MPCRPIGLLALSGLAGCGEDDDVVARPAPVEPTREASGHYCGMILVDHSGPKAQVHLPGELEPVWFSSVRDAIAFTMLPEEPRNFIAIYVNDMGVAQWEAPEPGTWIDANGAWYVIGSDRMGGMGVPEAVPFATREAAEGFVSGARRAHRRAHRRAGELHLRLCRRGGRRGTGAWGARMNRERGARPTRRRFIAIAAAAGGPAARGGARWGRDRPSAPLVPASRWGPRQRSSCTTPMPRARAA